MRMRHSVVVLLLLLSSMAFSQDTTPPSSQFGLIYPIGWRDNSLFAYARFAPLDRLCPACPRALEVVVQDLVTDEEVFRRTDSLPSSGDAAFRNWWRSQAGEVINELRSRGIRFGEPGRAVGGNTFSQGGWEYEVLVSTTAAERSVPSAMGPPTSVPSLQEIALVAVATDSRTGSSSWKSISRGPEYEEHRVAVSRAEAAGVILSPDGVRGAVVYRWETQGEHELIDFTVVGSHLVVGYAPGRPASPPSGGLYAIAEAGNLARELDGRAGGAKPLRPAKGDFDLETLRDLGALAATALAALDGDALAELINPDLGYYTLFAPGAAIQFTHAYEFRPGGTASAPPSVEEVRSRIRDEDIRPVGSFTTLSHILDREGVAEWNDPDRIARVESSIVAEVRLRRLRQQRLLFSLIDGRYYLTVVDEVDPFEA